MVDSKPKAENQLVSCYSVPDGGWLIGNLWPLNSFNTCFLKLDYLCLRLLNLGFSLLIQVLGDKDPHYLFLKPLVTHLGEDKMVLLRASIMCFHIFTWCHLPVYSGCYGHSPTPAQEPESPLKRHSGSFSPSVPPHHIAKCLVHSKSGTLL